MIARPERLQVALQDRYRRAVKADWNLADREVSYLRDFIVRSPRLRSILEAVQRRESEFDPAGWLNAHERGLDWPANEEQRAILAWHMVQVMAEMHESQQLARYAFQINRAGNFAEGVPALVETVAEPLVEYLIESLGSESDVLYLLARYRRRFEWWDRKHLLARFNDDPRRGESIFDDDLRRFLFDQGIDYPFSQPASASGRADLIAGMVGDSPLVCDLKIFDGDARGVPYLSKGVRQVVQYAHDYGQSVAYLVVVNVTDEDLELPTDADDNLSPSRVDVAGIAVYMVVLRAGATATASRTGRAAPRVVRREDLVAALVS